MANYLIAHGWAFRILANGIMESTRVELEGDQISVDEKGWTYRVPETMDLSGADCEHIRNQLSLNAQMFQEGRVRIYQQGNRKAVLPDVERVM